MESKIINDAVHGPMTFHQLLIVLIDTKQMQRLRNIKQLGTCFFVYPSATHTRFEHSLGTAFITGKLLDCLKEKGLPSSIDEECWEKNKLCAQIAGLCHDLGHGPFSHMWESFREKCKADSWSHEECSVSLLDEMLKEKISPSKLFNGKRLNTVEDAFKFYGLTVDDINLIKDMILGRGEKNNYLFQIICNKKNGIDVDKWEYITRDSKMVNVPVTFDYKRLLHYCRVMRDKNGHEQICFREKECTLVMEMFLARGILHCLVYQHYRIKIVDEMLMDAFYLAKDRLKLLETPISQLTDHIYEKILYEDFGNDKNMNEAKAILSRLEKRHLYKCIGCQTFEEKAPSLEKVKQHLSSLSEIVPFLDEIGMTTVNIDMTKTNKRKNLNNVLVYGKFSSKESRCWSFNWKKFDNSLKFDLGNLKRRKFFLLYKGTEDFPESLIRDINRRLKTFSNN